MAKGTRYSAEFKQEAVNQITVHGYPVADVAERLGISTKALYNWMRTYAKPPKQRVQEQDLQAEVARLKRELKRTQQERDILKEAAVGSIGQRYPFIKSRSNHYPVRLLCRALQVHPSGYYDWLKQPLSQRESADRKLLGQIKQLWIESGGHYGYRNIHKDLLEARITCGRDRVLRLMRQAGLKAQRGYKSPKGCYGGKPDIIAANTLNREFAVEEPNQWWVSDITYIHTQEGFLFLAVVMDLYARNIVGWSMGERMTEDLVL